MNDIQCFWRKLFAIQIFKNEEKTAYTCWNRTFL